MESVTNWLIAHLPETLIGVLLKEAVTTIIPKRAFVMALRLVITMISALALSSVVIVGMVLLQSFEHLPAAYSFEGFMFSRVAGSALSIIGLFAMRQQLLIPVQLGCLLWVILSHLWHLGRAATAGVQPALSSDPEP